MQCARPGEARFTARQRHLEESVALDREIQRVVGVPQVARAEVARGRDRAGAEAGLEADRRFRLLRRGRARGLDLLVDQILELDAALLEPGRVDVGQVVRHVVDVGLLRVHAAGRRVKCSNHVLSCGPT